MSSLLFSFCSPSGGVGAAMSPRAALRLGFRQRAVVEGVLGAVAFTLDFNKVSVMEESVEDGCGGGDIADEFAPFFEGAVGGHESGAEFVAAHDDLKEVFAGFGWELFDAHVVYDEQVAFEVALQGAFVAGGICVVAQVVKDVEDGAVEDDFVGFDELVADGLSEVTFASAGRADEEDVFVTFKEVSGCEVVDLFAVDAGIEAEVEAVEGAQFAEVGGFSAALDHALLAHVEFVLEDEFEELQGVEVVASSFLET